MGRVAARGLRRAPGSSRHLPPLPPHTCVYPAGSVAKKSLLTQCVCVCVCVCVCCTGWAENRLKRGTSSQTQTSVPGEPAQPALLSAVIPGPPEPRPSVRSRISSSVDAARPTEFFRFVLKTKGQANLGLSAPWPRLCRGAGSASRALGQSCPVQGQTLRSRNPRVAGRREDTLPRPLSRREGSR